MMGYTRHHAIVVTGTYGDWIDRAHAKALEIFPIVSEITAAATNGTRSFFVPPDGSKEGWEESDAGDMRRAAFIAWLRTLAYEDGSNPLGFAEIQYRDDEGDNRIIQADDQQPSSDNP